MKKIILLFLPLIFGMSFSEIMYDPEGSDNGKEWIKINDPNATNLENYTIFDATSNDTLKTIIFRNSTINIIIEDNFSYDNLTTNIYTAGSTIGNGLNNDKDNLTLKDPQGNTLITTYYNSSMGGKNGKTLCNNNGWTACELSDTIINETINETFFINNTNYTTNETLPVINQTTNTTTNTTNQTVDATNYTLTITEIMPNPQGNDRANYPQGEWIEIYNYGTENIHLEGLQIKDQGNHVIALGQTNLIKGTIITAKTYKILALNGWSIFNNGGDKITLIINNKTIDEISYGTIEENYTWSLIDKVWKRTQPTPEEKNQLMIINETETTNITPTLTILKKPTKVSYGKTINITIQALALPEETITITLANITTHFTTYEPDTTISIPLQLPENCDQTYPEGNQTLTISTPQHTTNTTITITKNTQCKKETKNLITTQAIIKTNKTSANINFENLIKQTPKTTYESTNKQLYKYSIYLFIVLSIISTLYYWKTR
ncbi:MAG: lamin tail domain-containing protein [Nanoarchaeota archaeon]|nr:lamin tail domain-containing protein [Nanoarchaeota archaeon]